RFTVLDRPQDDPAGRVAALVRGFLAKRSIDRSVGHDDDLSASGLSSLDMVNLMLAVEAEFDLKIPDRKMTPSNFRSIACITELVQALNWPGASVRYLSGRQRNKIAVAAIGHQHGARIVGDGQGRPRQGNRRLRCHPARPEHRDLIVADRYRVTVVGRRENGDAD